MAYNTKPIVTDVDGNPVSQYYNPTTDQYEPVEGSGGGNKVVLYNADGTENNSFSLIPILEKLSELTGTVIDEQTRQSNEQQRITFYNQLVEMLNTGQLKGDKGDTGETGRGLEFDWDGTRLGVRVEGDEEYIYVDLRGPQGPPGEIENLTMQHVINALGYTPIENMAKTARFVVGTSRFVVGTSRWTEKDCDYLCDGTNDQEEINRAIRDLPDSGGEIIILDGTYNITATINVNKNNVSIKGNGNATILKRMWNSSSEEGVITLNSVEGCRIQNLQIDGNKADYMSTNNHGIRLNSSNNNTITGNICNNNNYGIYLDSSNNNTITGNICKNAFIGIRLYSSSNENTITGNICNNNNYGIYLDSSNNENTITGNICKNAFIGIRLYSSNNENTITGNICNNNNYGIHLDSSNNENTITGNTCNNNNDNGISLYSSSNENTITGNICNNNYNGIYLCSSNNNTITGNTCNNNYNGIHLNSSSYNTITGNTCIRGTGYGSDQYTILLAGSSNNYNLVSSNNCMGKAVVVQGGTGNSVWGNKFDATNNLPS